MKYIIVKLIKDSLGNILVALRPKKVRQLSKKGLTLELGNNLNFPERLMRRALLKKIEKAQEYDKLAELHKSYWTKQGDNFVNYTENKLENTNLPAYKTILDVLKNEVSNESIKFNKLIEIGTGNGSVLDYLSSRYSNIDSFIGIDLSEKQTKINQEKYKNNNKLEFVGGDVLDWIENQEQANMVFLTFRGVLEYFTQPQLINFFEKLNTSGNIIFFAIEPTDSAHNFEEHPDSKVYGFEASFSHNHKKLFEDAGFKIWYSDQKKESWHTNIMRIIGAKNF
ncbi:class I SAM-dependent methyltransferase [Winogradskyella costae]|uniref:class I SAM-dependent methyltransferase n=1 Tax=Winogradskyella costae TaxID=2697008 RepID=UPI0015C94905|nr:class I SAM-dependent methyltransferase [Winogradskyella costae]